MSRRIHISTGTRSILWCLFAVWTLTGCYDELLVANVTYPEEEAPTDNEGSDEETESREGEEDNEPDDPPLAPNIDCGKEVWNYSITIENLVSEDWDFSDITHIRGNLNISDPHELYEGFSDLSALQELRCVDGNVYISNLPDLENLDALFNLRKIGGDIFINWNSSLEDIDGLDGVEWFGGDILSIWWNEDLSTCDALDFRRQFPYLDLNEDSEICISRNLPDCPDDQSGCSYL